MRTLTIRITILLYAAVALGQAQSSREESGTLVVELKTLLGGKLAWSTVVIRSESGDLVSSFNRNDGSDALDEVKTVLPYGTYTVTVKGTFLVTASRKVVVDQPNCFVVLATDMGREVLDFRIDRVAVSIATTPAEPCDPKERLWAKLIAVYGDYSAERLVGPHGFALFEPVELGKYILVIAEGDRVRGLTPVTTKGTVTRIKVQLSPCE